MTWGVACWLIGTGASGLIGLAIGWIAGRTARTLEDLFEDWMQ